MSRVIVIGAGAMGLAAAYRALKLGHEVRLVEAAPEAGGMAAHFDLAGLSIERFYHFVCKADQPTFDLLDELGLGDTMRWVSTSMGYFTKGKLHDWGDPVSLLRFPHLNPVQKFRYALLAFVSTRRKDWPSLENRSAKDWIRSWCGDEVYQKLWHPLFYLKFYQYAENISAAWIWTRIKRVGTSRRSMMQEELGYIEGGSQTLVDALVDKINTQGGILALGDPAKRVVIEDNKVKGLETQSGFYQSDAVISTVPTPFVPQLVPDLPRDWRETFEKILNIGVICVVFRLKRRVTRHFWVNVFDDRMPIPGIIEFSNLRPVANGETVVYVPYYMPPDNPLWGESDEEMVSRSLACLSLLNPEITENDVVASYVGRLRHAQPVCPPGFAKVIPPVQTPIAGLQIADTCYYYPEDRGIAESVRLGQEMAHAI